MTHAFNLISNGTGYAYIDDEGKDHRIDQIDAVQKVLDRHYTVKVEGLEEFFDEKGTVHAFIAPAGAVSFGPHIDMENLEILCIEGIKGFNVGGKLYNLRKGDSVLVPAGAVHHAVNLRDSIMLSIELCTSQ